MRTYDPKLIREAINYLLKHDDTDIDTWVANPANIALLNDKGDLALFEPSPGAYSGHYYFKSRGKQAIISGRELLNELFNTEYNIHVLIGLVPIKHLGARWMTKKLGFTPNGVVKIKDNPYEMFILTRKEFNSCLVQ